MDFPDFRRRFLTSSLGAWQAAHTSYIYRSLPGLGHGLQIGYKIQKLIDVKKAHIAVSLILLVAETGIEPVTRGFSIHVNEL